MRKYQFFVCVFVKDKFLNMIFWFQMVCKTMLVEVQVKNGNIIAVRSNGINLEESSKFHTKRKH